MGRMGMWRWGVAVEKSQDWVDANASALVGEFTVDGERYALPVIAVKRDEGNDSNPDKKWTKGDIMTWMDDKGIPYAALSTKAKLLDNIDAFLNPTEDAKSDEVMDDTTGDE